jgi:SAM-dependent methyltransferase
MTEAEPRRAPAAERNREPILAVLQGILPIKGRALEVASGTGQHVAAFAAAFPEIVWQPSDPDPAARDSIAAWAAQSRLTNLLQPIALDTCQVAWDTKVAGPLDAVLCANMIHIAPWAACEGLMRGAGTLLRPGGLLYLYGPYRRENRHTSPSNQAFDGWLRDQNADWGVRDLEAVSDSAQSAGLILEETVAMPANNFSLIFRRARPATGGASAPL